MFARFYVIILLSFLLGYNHLLHAETIYFFVGEIEPFHNDGYVLPLDDPFDIEHARDLINYGPSIGNAIVVAYFYGDPGINRNYAGPGIPAWSWSIAYFLGFADSTAEILDGWPTEIEEGMFIGDTIGFWSYTVVKELGTFTEMQSCNCDLTLDGNVDSQDFALFAEKWRLQHNGGADMNFDQYVDMYDLAILANCWLK